MKKFEYTQKNGMADKWGQYDVEVKIYHCIDSVEKPRYLGEIVYSSSSNKGVRSEVMRYLMNMSFITIEASQNKEGNYYDKKNTECSICKRLEDA